MVYSRTLSYNLARADLPCYKNTHMPIHKRTRLYTPPGLLWNPHILCMHLQAAPQIVSTTADMATIAPTRGALASSGGQDVL